MEENHVGVPPISTTRGVGSDSLSPSNILRSPLSALLEYSGILRHNPIPIPIPIPIHVPNIRESAETTAGAGEVSIRIIVPSDSSPHHHHHNHHHQPFSSLSSSPHHNPIPSQNSNESSFSDSSPHHHHHHHNHHHQPFSSLSSSSYQRYDIQHAARCLEQILPFSLLFLLLFIRQHFQGFFVTIWIAALLFKSNDIVRKQTALKGERKMHILIALSIAFTLQVIAVYWWYHNHDLIYPLLMLPPTDIPPFWHAFFIIILNDILVRQAAMVFKCILLMYFKNTTPRNYRKQGQLLTLVEYLLLLYRALLPTPVWYRFFLNKEYGTLFSSLITGLYLTFKLTSVVEKVQSFFAAVKELSIKEVHYGAYATSEQVNAAGDLCAICQEKMHVPVLLRCKHIFCEDCVSEWFERERTCPLCRALVKPADLKSFGDGSTSLFLQFF